MIDVTIELTSLSPYSQSRYHNTPKEDGESDAAHSKRTWREFLHRGDNGMVFIPPMALKMALETAGSMLSMKMSGKGRQTWTKHFKSGLIVTEPIKIGVTCDDFHQDIIFASSTGKKGAASGSRVERIYPTIAAWKAQAKALILSDELSKEQPIFEKHLECAGQMVGLGRFRAECGGYYGRFRGVVLSWDKI